MDTMSFEILEDGTIKFKTDKFSNACHQSADDFLKAVAREMAGGRRTIEARQDIAMTRAMAEHLKAHELGIEHQH